MRKAARCFAIAAFLLSPLAFGAADAQALSLADKTQLQIAMQRHVDRLMIDGAYLHFSVESGEVIRLNPVTAHPMIMQMGEHYVLCFDFRDEAGNELPVDFYIARKNKAFQVFYTAVNSRSVLKNLMEAGKVSRAE